MTRLDVKLSIIFDQNIVAAEKRLTEICAINPIRAVYSEESRMESLMGHSQESGCSRIAADADRLNSVSYAGSCQ